MSEPSQSTNISLPSAAATQFREVDLRFGSPVGFHIVPFPQGRRVCGTVVVDIPEEGIHHPDDNTGHQQGEDTNSTTY